jgi:putative ABC transport system permease protein
VAANRSLRQNAIIIFDRTFAITYALEAVAIAVAMLGAANSLLAMVLDRRRELGLLRFLGAAPGQVRRLILMEAGFLGLAAIVLGVALGFVLSLVLIYVINRQSFGWTIQFHPPFALLTGAVALIWLTTVLAGLYPARAAARLNPIEVIHDE